MSRRFAILSAGVDAARLAVRNRHLQENGYTVVPATSRNETIVTAGNRHFDATILCWSFDHELERLESDLAIVNPDCPILTLQPSTRPAAAEDDALLDTLDWLLRKRRGRTAQRSA